MKYFLLLCLLLPASSWACKVKLDIVKNQSEFKLDDFTQFKRGLKKRGYDLVPTNFSETLQVRIMKRYNDHLNTSLFALVSVDVYDSNNVHTIYASRKGPLSTRASEAYSVSSFDSALASMLEDFPKCGN
jgi:hypothetical protein